MRQDEVEGVLAHEVAHIANGDMVTMTLLQGVINAFVMFFARIIAFALATRGGSRDDRGGGVSWIVVIVLEIVLGILGSLITAWFSRQREFRADRGGATLAGRDRMLGALRRLAANRELVDTQHQALATLKINGDARLDGVLLDAPAARSAHRGARTIPVSDTTHDGHDATEIDVIVVASWLSSSRRSHDGDDEVPAGVEVAGVDVGRIGLRRQRFAGPQLDLQPVRAARHPHGVAAGRGGRHVEARAGLRC